MSTKCLVFATFSIELHLCKQPRRDVNGDAFSIKYLSKQIVN